MTGSHKILLVNDHQDRYGIGRYIFQVYDAFARMRPEDYSFELLMQNMGKCYTANTSDTQVQYRHAWARQGGFGKHYDIMAYFYFPRKIPDGYSLYHISSQMMGRSAVFQSPVVVTCHDLISYKVKSNHPRLNQYLRRKQVAALTQATAIIFISQHTRDDFLSLFDYPGRNISVIPLAASDLYQPRDKITCRTELGLPLERPIILHVGAEAYRKNIPVLLRAVHSVKKQVPDILLIRIGPQRKRSRELVKKLRLEKNVLYLGKRTEQDLVKYYNAADLFVFPSIYEGFGLPAIEAMKSGCPLVASNATSIPEITGDAAILHHPEDVDAFADSILTILDSKSIREEYSRRGIERAKQFSWQNTARKTLDVYRSILEG